VPLTIVSNVALGDFDLDNLFFGASKSSCFSLLTTGLDSFVAFPRPFFSTSFLGISSGFSSTLERFDRLSTITSCISDAVSGSILSPLVLFERPLASFGTASIAFGSSDFFLEPPRPFFTISVASGSLAFGFSLASDSLAFAFSLASDSLAFAFSLVSSSLAFGFPLALGSFFGFPLASGSLACASIVTTGTSFALISFRVALSLALANSFLVSFFF
jgi:hypothetical protein